MAVEDVQQLLDLMAISPEVTELTVQGASGSRVTIKRSLSSASPSYAVEPSFDQLEDAPAQPNELVAPVPQLTITASLVGLFHAAAPPVASGASVVPGQIVGYIESMRLMNEITSTVTGTVDVVIAEEGQAVEYGQPLFALNRQ